MKTLLHTFMSTAFCAVLSCVSVAMAWDQWGLARTPQMGWNSWNYFGCNGTHPRLQGFRGYVNFDLVKEIAEAMISTGMVEAGYNYLNLDDCWGEATRNLDGGIMPSRELWPNGFREVVDWVHAKGLKMGIYTSAHELTCAQTMPGTLNHVYQDADSIVAWGFDYLKYDWCRRQSGGLDTALKDFPMMQDALLKAYDKYEAIDPERTRPILYAMCNWGKADPWLWAKDVAHSWRTTLDIHENWGRVMELLDQNVDLYPYAGPGGWNDADMLEVDNGLNVTESRSHFSLWCMLASPLIAGNDVRNMTQPIIDILTNREAIAVDQDSLGHQGRRVKKQGDLEVWARHLSGNDYAVLFFNRGTSPANISATWADIGIADPGGLGLSPSTPRYARDLWAHQNLGQVTGTYTANNVPGHGVQMIWLSETEKTGGGCPDPTYQEYASNRIYDDTKLCINQVSVYHHDPAANFSLRRDRETVFLTLSRPGGAELIVSDVTGKREHIRLQTEAETVFFSTSRLAAGIYILQVRQQAVLFQRRLAVVR